MFVTCETEKPPKPTVSVHKDSVDSKLSSKQEAECALESHQEKQEGIQSRTELSTNVKQNVVKHAEKKCGKAKRKNKDTNELLPTKKRKRIRVLSDSEDSSSDGE